MPDIDFFSFLVCCLLSYEKAYENVTVFNISRRLKVFLTFAAPDFSSFDVDVFWFLIAKMILRVLSNFRFRSHHRFRCVCVFFFQGQVNYST